MSIISYQKLWHLYTDLSITPLPIHLMACHRGSNQKRLSYTVISSRIIMVKWKDDDPTHEQYPDVKIGDFGHAVSFPVPNNQAASCMMIIKEGGTQKFHPPEWFKNSYLSVRSDVWGVGTIIHCLCHLGDAPYLEDDTELQPSISPQNGGNAGGNAKEEQYQAMRNKRKRSPDSDLNADWDYKRLKGDPGTGHTATGFDSRYLREKEKPRQPKDIPSLYNEELNYTMMRSLELKFMERSTSYRVFERVRRLEKERRTIMFRAFPSVIRRDPPFPSPARETPSQKDEDSGSPVAFRIEMPGDSEQRPISDNYDFDSDGNQVV